jgi:hypothetical protein
MNRMAWSSHVERGVVVKPFRGSTGVAHCVSLTAGGETIRES